MGIGKALVLGAAGLAAIVLAERVPDIVFKDRPAYMWDIREANGAETSKFKYSVIGAPIPTAEVLIAEGYKCINCDAPREKKPFKANPDEVIKVRIFQKGNYAVALESFENGSKYGIPFSFQEGNIITKSFVWSTAQFPGQGINQIHDNPSTGTVDVVAYLKSK